MPTMTTGDIGLRTAGYISAELLKRANPHLVMQPFLQTKPIPRNSSQTVKFRRYEALAAASTNITEGVTPPGSTITSTDYNATLDQIGDWVGITDQVQDTHEDPIIMEYQDILAEQAALTVETKLFYVLRGGSNVFRANGTQRDHINTTLTKNLQQKVTRLFKRQNARVITKKLSSDARMDTVSVKPSFIAFCHPDLEPVVQGLAGFKDVVDYGGSMTPYPTEIGSVGDVRYLTSTVISSWADAGGTKAGSGTTMVSTTGTSADVYPIIYISADCAAVTPLKGSSALTPFVKNPGEPREGDQLGQRGWIGWKSYFAALILNQAWIARVECAVPEL
jgi:N4-gp56 family major capsid protein